MLFFLTAAGFLFLTACKKEEPKDDYPIISFGFYYVDKSTGENLIGDGKPFRPEDLQVFIMYNRDTTTKTNYENNFGYNPDENGSGDIFIVDVASNIRTDYILYLGTLPPDTITLPEGLSYKLEDQEFYLNGEKKEKLVIPSYEDMRFIKIEKEL